MPEIPAIIIPKLRHLESRPGYGSFMDALSAAYNLRKLAPNQLTWVGIDNLEGDCLGTPRVMVNPGKDHPRLSVALHPYADGSPITGSYV